MGSDVAVEDALDGQKRMREECGEWHVALLGFGTAKMVSVPAFETRLTPGFCLMLDLYSPGYRVILWSLGDGRWEMGADLGEEEQPL